MLELHQNKASAQQKKMTQQNKKYESTEWRKYFPDTSDKQRYQIYKQFIQFIVQKIQFLTGQRT